MAVFAVALKNVYDLRSEITKGLEIVYQAPIMRHFTVRLQRRK